MRDTILQGNIPKLYRKYLIPTLIGMLSNSLYCLVDVYFVAQGAGNLGIAALNIAMPIFTILSAVGLLFGVGAATIMSIAEGQKDMHARDKAFTLAMVFMVMIGLAFTLYSNFFLETFAYQLGSSKELLPYVMDYLRPISLVSIPFTIMYANSILLRADHNPKLAMYSLVVGNVSNMILDYVFVMVFGWGIFGAAFATAISPCLTLLVASTHFFRKQNQVHFVKDFWDTSILKRMVKNGLGSGCMELSAGIVIMIFNAVILSISDATHLAAYGIITNIAYVFKGLLNGFAQAGQPIISTNYGARKMDRVTQGLKVTLLYSSVFAIVLYILFLMFPQEVCMPFADGDNKLIQIASNGVVLYFSSLVFMSANIMIMYYFQGIERGNISTVLALCKGIVFVTIGLLILVPLFHINGVWLCITFAEGFCTVIGLYLIYRQKRC